MQRRSTLTAITTAVALASIGAAPAAFAQIGGTIKVGILHCLPDAMTITEATLNDTVLMAIEEN